MEMPGKSSSEDEPQGAAFSGEALMGTLSDAANKHSLYIGPYLILSFITPLPCIFLFSFSPSPRLTSEESSQLDLDSVVGPGLSSLSNDEAAMAVIMSLLETDTNLGEAVDFEEMHWSL